MTLSPRDKTWVKNPLTFSLYFFCQNKDALVFLKNLDQSELILSSRDLGLTPN